MGLQKATYTGIEPIMSAYDAIMQDEQFSYSVWHSVRDIAFQWNNNDSERGREFLYNNLIAMEQAENDCLLYLKFHPPGVKGYIDNKSKVVSMMPVRVVDVKGGVTQIEPANGNNYQMFEAIRTIKDLPMAIDSKLSAMEARLLAIEEQETYEPEPDKIEKTIGQITGLLNNPNVMGIVGMILQKFIPGAVTQAQINGPDSGEVDKDKLNDALNRLIPYCQIDVDLSLLADLAETNTPMFNMVLSQLRQLKK